MKENYDLETLAEAMLLGTPVIATAWSANMEFMNEDVACLVPAEIVELQEDHPPYHKGKQTPKEKGLSDAVPYRGHTANGEAVGQG